MHLVSLGFSASLLSLASAITVPIVKGASSSIEQASATSSYDEPIIGEGGLPPFLIGIIPPSEPTTFANAVTSEAYDVATSSTEYSSDSMATPIIEEGDLPPFGIGIIPPSDPTSTSDTESYPSFLIGVPFPPSEPTSTRTITNDFTATTSSAWSETATASESSSFASSIIEEGGDFPLFQFGASATPTSNSGSEPTITTVYYFASGSIETPIAAEGSESIYSFSTSTSSEDQFVDPLIGIIGTTHVNTASATASGGSSAITSSSSFPVSTLSEILVASSTSSKSGFEFSSVSSQASAAVETSQIWNYSSISPSSPAAVSTRYSDIPLISTSSTQISEASFHPEALNSAAASYTSLAGSNVTKSTEFSSATVSASASGIVSASSSDSFQSISFVSALAPNISSAAAASQSGTLPLTSFITSLATSVINNTTVTVTNKVLVTVTSCSSGFTCSAFKPVVTETAPGSFSTFTTIVEGETITMTTACSDSSVNDASSAPSTNGTPVISLATSVINGSTVTQTITISRNRSGSTASIPLSTSNSGGSVSQAISKTSSGSSHSAPTSVITAGSGSPSSAPVTHSQVSVIAGGASKKSILSVLMAGPVLAMLV